MYPKPEIVEPFAGDKKDGDFLLSEYEKIAINHVVEHVPKQIEGYHLTLCTIVWCCAIIVFGYLASTKNIDWLWGTSVMIILHYITDSLDGTLGKKHNIGIVKWGYYMDHLLDYFLLCSIFIGYSFLINNTVYIALIMTLVVGYMVSSYLHFATTNKFRISFFKIGPTELRILFIILNTLLILFYNHIRFDIILPGVSLLTLSGLVYLIYDTQKQIWQEDMRIKDEEEIRRQLKPQ